MEDKDSNRLEHLRWIFDKQIGWIGSAETKSAIFITFVLAIFAALGTLFELKLITNKDLNWCNYSLIIAIVAAVFGLMALISLLRVFLPVRNVSNATHSFIYFDLITARSETYYKEEIPKKEYKDFAEDMAVQIYANAQIVKIKYNLVKKGVFFTTLAITFAVLSVLVKVYNTVPENSNTAQIILNNN